MDHIVYLDENSNEMENLLLGNKSMIIRASSSRKIPYDSVNEGDFLYLVNGVNEVEIKARGLVSSVYCSGLLTVEESFETIIRNQDKLQLPDNIFEKIAGKEYLVLVGLSEIKPLAPLAIKSKMLTGYEDWFTVGRIEEYILSGQGIITS